MYRLVVATLVLSFLHLCTGNVKQESDGLVAALLPHEQLGLVNGVPSAIFKFDLNNPTSRPITFLKWGTPLEDKLYSSIFQVKNTKTNEPATYVGIYAYRYFGKPTTDLFVTIQPGETISSTVDITEFYDFSSEDGTAMFTVSLDTMLIYFDGPFEDLGSHSLLQSNWKSALKQVELVTEPLQLIVTEREIPDHPDRADSRGIVYSGCSGNQPNELVNYMKIAAGQAQEAVNYLNVRRCDVNYVTWFGVYDNNRWNRAKQNFQNVLSNINQVRYNYRCQPKGAANCKLSDDGQSGVVAYVYPINLFHEINLCDFFWTGRFDSTFRGAVLIHELTHFADVAGTMDVGYGDEFCKDLARTNPAKALTNAANHHLFAQYHPKC